jgi:hypothetical protein
MPWPLSQDYNEAIQSPAQCFGDPELKQGEAVTNALGLPQTCSGNFADVYAVQCGVRKWAVKCFTRQITGLQERYAQISLYLQQVNLPFMVDFKFLQNGIRVRGDWYPVLKMEWVEGFALNAFIRENLDKPKLLHTLGELWVKLALRLREANLAHCDLQHGNVLLVPGKREGSLAVKLIDYDGMLVPALTGKRSGEVGHASYQHPQRLREGTFTLDVDRFPHLVIYTALQALRHGGRALWDRYDNGDNLLFKQTDLASPRTSPLFQELGRGGEPSVRQLAQTLAIASQKLLDQTPLLEQAAGVPAGKPVTVARLPRGDRRTLVAPRRKRVRWVLAVAACLALVVAALAFIPPNPSSDEQARRPTSHVDRPPTAETAAKATEPTAPATKSTIKDLGRGFERLRSRTEEHRTHCTTLQHVALDLRPVQEAEIEQTNLERLQKEHSSREGSDSIAKELTATRQEIALARQRVELIQSLHRAMDKTDLDAYARQATAYTRAFADEDRAKAFSLVAKELPLWQATLEWNKVVRGLGKDPLVVRVKDSQARSGPLEICRAFHTRYPQAPSSALIGSYVEFLEAIGQRDESEAKSALNELRNLFELPYVKDMYYMEVDGGKKYYAKEDFAPKLAKATDFVKADVLITLDGKTETRNIRYKRVQKKGKAPQARVAEEAAKELKKLMGKSGAADWDDVLIKIVSLIQDEEDMDPFVKDLLFRRVLTAAGRGSPPLREALAGSLDALTKEEKKLDLNVVWIDPDDAKANEARPAAKKVVAAVEDMRKVAKATTEKHQKLITALFKSERVPCGWLLKTQQTGWNCESAGKPPKGELFVLVPAGDSAEWQPVGHVGLDGATVETTSKALQEGRMVILLKATP